MGVPVTRKAECGALVRSDLVDTSARVALWALIDTAFTPT
jgi:hypothetical protein